MEIKGKYAEISNPIENRNEGNPLWNRPIPEDKLVKRQQLQKSAIAAYENIGFDRLA